jgi:hypothetical protein
MTEILYWIWLSLIALGTGRWLIQRVLKLNRTGGENLFALGLGYGLLSTGTTILGFSQLLYKPLILAILVALTGLLFYGQRNSLRKVFTPGTGLNKNITSRSRFEWFCLILIGLICLRNFLGALTPELRHDVLDYHITFPNLYALHHGIYETPWHVFSYMPANVEMLYTLALVLSSDILAKLIHYGFSLIALGAICWTGARYLDRRTGTWGALLWLLVPLVGLLTSTAYIDLAVSAWAFLATAAMLKHLEARGCLAGRQPDAATATRWLVLSALFTGWTLGSKYTASLLFGFPLSAAVLLLALLPDKWTGVRLSPRAASRIIGFLVLIGGLMVSPWLIANFVWTGNPVYPIQNQLLGLTSPVEADAEAFIRDHAPHFSSFQDVWGHIIHQLGILSVDGTLSMNLALVLIPMMLLCLISYKWEGQPAGEKKTRAGVFFLLILAALVYLMWALATANKDGRFMMPGYLALHLMLAMGYWKVFEWFAGMMKRPAAPAVLATGLTLVLSLNYVYHLSVYYTNLYESPWPVLGKENREQYIRRKYKDLDLTLYINEHLPEDSLVFGAGYPAQRAYVSHVKHGVHPILSRTGQENYSAKQLAEALRDAGATHVIAPRSLGIPTEVAANMEQAGFQALLHTGGRTLYKVPPEAHPNR